MGPLWNYARAVAVPYYARHGWTIARDEFIISIDGPHPRDGAGFAIEEGADISCKIEV